MRVLISRYPCCRGRCRFYVRELVSRQVYTRECPGCGSRFTVERRLLLAGHALYWSRVINRTTSRVSALQEFPA